jgi:hypothetical protein
VFLLYKGPLLLLKTFPRQYYNFNLLCVRRCLFVSFKASFNYLINYLIYYLLCRSLLVVEELLSVRLTSSTRTLKALVVLSTLSIC